MNTEETSAEKRKNEKKKDKRDVSEIHLATVSFRSSERLCNIGFTPLPSIHKLDCSLHHVITVRYETNGLYRDDASCNFYRH